MKTGKLKYFFRWIVVLPGAILGALLSTIPLHWLLYLGFAENGTLLGIIELPPGSNLNIEYQTYPLVIALVFVWSGYRLAPRYKFKTAVVFFAMYVITWTVMILMTFIRGGFGTTAVNFGARTVLALIGAISGLYIAKTDSEKELKK